MRKKSRKLVSPWSLGSIPLTEVPNRSGWISRSEFYAQEAAAEKEAKEKPIKEAIEKVSVPMRQLNREIADAWRQPLPEIVVLVQNKAEVMNDILSPLPEGKCSREQSQAAFAEFLDELTTSAYALSEQGKHRLLLYCLNAALHDKNIGTVDAVRQCFERLVQLEAFGPELTCDESKQPVAPEPAQPTLDEIFRTTHGGTAEGRKALIAAVEEDVYTRGEFRQCWKAFTDSLVQNFGYYLSEKEKRTFYDTMVRRGLSLNRPTDYDQCRVALVRSGDLPSSLLYPQEILDKDIEQADLNDYEKRMEFARRSRQLTR